MDTCFLCQINLKNKKTGKAPLRKTTTDGFGTCRTCNVHACPQHGDRISAHFQCADCNAGISVNAAMTPPQPGTLARPGGADDQEAVAAQMVEWGAAGFAALAPRVAIPAMSLIEGDSADRMQRTLESLVRDYGAHRRLGLAEHLGRAITEQTDQERVLSLGLDEAGPGDEEAGPGDEEAGPEDEEREGAAAHAPLREVVSARVEVLDRAAVLALDRMPLISEYGPRQAEFVALAVASALQPRGADSLDEDVLNIPGGLTIPALLFAILVRYQAERR
jgi:hypothetical protein